MVEGQSVAAGEVLAVLAAPRATLVAGDTALATQAGIAERQHRIAESLASRRQQLEAQRDGLQLQVATLRDELAQLAGERATRRQQQALAEATQRRFEQLRRQHYVTDLQLQQQQSLVLEQLGAAQALDRQALALRRLRAQLQQALAEIPPRIAALEAESAREQAELGQAALENRARAQSVVSAPVAGVVSHLSAQAGQALQAGQGVLGLLPEGAALEAHLQVPSRAVGFAAAGDPVLLRYPAFPYQRFGLQRGHVLRVSRSASAEGAGEPHYRIIVALERQSVRAFGREEPLKPGMQLEADLLGETRRLWRWALDPMRALSAATEGPP